MKIEYIGLAIIAIVVAIDLIRRRVNKTSKSTDVESFDFTKPTKNKVKLIWIIIPIAVAIIGGGVGAYLYLQPTKYAIDEVAFNNNLAYLKTDMSLLNGRIEDSLQVGNFVDGKKVGNHKIQYLYTGEDTIMNFAEGDFIDNHFHGPWIFYHQNGKKHAEVNYLKSDGKSKGSSGIPNEGREGLFRSWHENGQLQDEANYVNDEREGLSRFWYENGQLRIKTNYVNKKLEGVGRWWHENGQLAEEHNYVNGKVEGLVRWWHENGQLAEEHNYVNGILEGRQKQWSEDGKLIRK